MKFSEMPYARPDLDELKQQLQALTDQLKSAPDYASAHEAFLAQQKLSTHIDTLATLSSVRNSIDTRDKFYDAEEQFWNEAGPELRAYDDAWTAAMLESPFRKDFAAEYGDLMFVNAEIGRKAFSPAIVEELKQENQLVQDYQKLIAGAQIDFEGSTYTISQLSPFKNSPDDAVRLAAWKAEGGWYKAHQPELDEIYDKLVRLRDAMGRKLGYDGFTQLGYYRMGRNCYTKEDVEKFRAAVVKYVVPVASSIYREQAARLGKSYPMNFADNALMFRTGNPRPCGTPAEILAQGKHYAGNFYSLIAGYLEIGESLEQAACREALEETGLHIRDLTYFGNQPWPFTDTQMVGFFARADDREPIRLQEEELRDARWFTRDDMPVTAPGISIASAMIDAWRKGTGPAMPPEGDAHV